MADGADPPSPKGPAIEGPYREPDDSLDSRLRSYLGNHYDPTRALEACERELRRPLRVSPKRLAKHLDELIEGAENGLPPPEEWSATSKKRARAIFRKIEERMDALTKAQARSYPVIIMVLLGIASATRESDNGNALLVTVAVAIFMALAYFRHSVVEERWSRLRNRIDDLKSYIARPAGASSPDMQRRTMGDALELVQRLSNVAVDEKRQHRQELLDVMRLLEMGEVEGAMKVLSLLSDTAQKLGKRYAELGESVVAAGSGVRVAAPEGERASLDDEELEEENDASKRPSDEREA